MATLTNALGTVTNRNLLTSIVRAIADQREAGAAAAPALVTLAADPQLAPLVTFALAAIHGDFELSRPLLLSAATNGNPIAIYALGNYGAAMRPWLSQLSVVSNHPDLNVRYHWNIAAEKILHR